MKKNKGFSLVEILVVIAIMAVMVSAVALSYNIIDKANVAKAARTYDTAIDTARNMSMAKGPDAGVLILSMSGGKLYYQIGETSEKKEICGPMISVTVMIDSPYSSRSGGIAMADGAEYRLYFNSAGTLYLGYTGGTCTNVTKLIFSRGDRHIEVILYKETGKHTTNFWYA